MTREEALAALSGQFDVPPDAVLEEFRHFDYGAGRRMVQLRWRRVFEGLPVRGHYLRVVLHPVTHRIVEYDGRW